MLLAWLGARALFLRAGAEGILRALGAREPRAGDLVLLLDGTAANAAAVGSSPDATIIVSRRLLDELDREETQAMIGHLVGAVGNGDPCTALVVLSMYRAFGLVMTALGAAFDRSGARGRGSQGFLESTPPVSGRAGP